jgi:hypothetical protein
MLYALAVRWLEFGDLSARRITRRRTFRDTLIFCVPQFLDARLLPGEQAFTQDCGFRGLYSIVERALPADMGDMGRADQDLGRHAADIDAGAAEGAALDEGNGRWCVPPEWRRPRLGCRLLAGGKWADRQSTTPPAPRPVFGSDMCLSFGPVEQWLKITSVVEYGVKANERPRGFIAG